MAIGRNHGKRMAVAPSRRLAIGGLRALSIDMNAVLRKLIASPGNGGGISELKGPVFWQRSST
jgi:hypothetical protein